MVNILIFVLFIFIISVSLYVFEKAFKKGEVFDVTKKHPKKGCKLDECLNEVKVGIDYINSLICKWIYIDSADGLKLAGRFFEKENSDKIIILFHGYRSVAENDFGCIFKWYYEQGFNILLVDQRSHGRSEGNYITFGVKERLDCVKWCEYVSENFENINEIILGGMSMGSTTILLAAGLELPSKVRGIIADCGFTSPKDIISIVASRGYGINARVILPVVNLLCRIIAKFNVYECSVIDAMKKNTRPILFIHGTSDDFVPSKMSKENYDACKSRKRLVFVDCVNHGLSYLKDKARVQNEILEFINNLR